MVRFHFDAPLVFRAPFDMRPGVGFVDKLLLIPDAHQMRQAPSSETMHGPTGFRGVQDSPYKRHSVGFILPKTTFAQSQPGGMAPAFFRASSAYTGKRKRALCAASVCV